MNRRVILLMGLLVATSCTLPRVDLPAPYEDQGVRVAVDGLYKQGLSYVGLTGKAQNISDRDYTGCILSFDIVDSTGAKVCDATAFTQNFRSGQIWRFQALFTAPFATTFKGIRPGRITVMKTPEDIRTDMQSEIAKARSAAAIAEAPAPDPHSRLLGVFCEHRLPNGDLLPRITRIESGSLAEQCGWQVGDLIIAVDDKPVRSLTDVVLATQLGSRLKVYTLQRGEEAVKSTVNFPF